VLILTCRIGETLKTGDTIDVTVDGIKGSQIRVGIAAPRNVPAHREEIHEMVNADAAVATGHC
jgi:carbon storage regulator